MNTDNIRDRLNKKKIENEDAKKHIQDGFMNSIQKLMYDFEKKVDNKQIEIKDTNDIYKLFVIFSQMQNLTGDDSTGGLLPQLSHKQQDVFKEISTENSQGEAIIDMDKIAELSEEDIAELIAGKEKEMNMENAETF